MKKFNAWPLGIAAFFGFMCCMIVLTVYISQKYKPDDDNAYFSTRQAVDKDINDILIAQRELESKYRFFILDGESAIPLTRQANRKSPPLRFSGDFRLRFKMSDLENADIKAQNARIYITRFADSSADKDIGEIFYNGAFLESPQITLNKGDWKLLVEFMVDDKRAYFEQRIVVDSAESMGDLGDSMESTRDSSDSTQNLKITRQPQ